MYIYIYIYMCVYIYRLTCERLKGTARKWSLNAWFCSGSSTSSSADEGSIHIDLSIYVVTYSYIYI